MEIREETFDVVLHYALRIVFGISALGLIVAATNLWTHWF